MFEFITSRPVILYAEDHFTTIESKTKPPPSAIAGYHHYGQGSDGYGSKICSDYLVRLDKRGPWRRVYITCFSNSGSLWIMVKHKGLLKKFHFHNDENLRLTGEWPREPKPAA